MMIVMKSSIDDKIAVSVVRFVMSLDMTTIICLLRRFLLQIPFKVPMSRLVFV